MGIGETWGTIPLIIAILGLVLLQYFFSRRRRSQTVPRDIVRNVLSEVMLNLAYSFARTRDIPISPVLLVEYAIVPGHPCIPTTEDM